MEFAQAIRSRRMVRRYIDAEVSSASVERIIEAGRRAPSAGNTRGTHFIVAADHHTRSRIADAANEQDWVARGKHAWLSSAPIHVVILADPAAYDARYTQPDKHASAARSSTGSWEIPWWWVDAGAALMAVLVAAVDEGLGAGFLGGHALEGIEEVLSVPDGMEVVGVVTIGHPHPDDSVAGSAHSGPPTVDEVVHYERWDSR